MRDPLDNHEMRRLLRSFPADAVKILWSQTSNGLVKIALSLTGDEDAAKDIVQDTFSHLWLHASQLADFHARSIQHYLVKVVRNKSMAYYNEQVLLVKRRIQFAGSVDLSEQSMESSIIQIEVTHDILEMIARFPRRERECLTLKLDEELTNREISVRLGVGIKAVERSLTSARKRLRRELQLKLNKKLLAFT